MNNNNFIVIVGAGLAGLGAALTLQSTSSEKCTDFIILEAQNQAGGRIQTLKLDGGGVIDLGAQWVHGMDTELYEILQEHNLIHPETSDEGLGIYVRDDGHHIDKTLVKKVDFQVGKILKDCENYLDVVTNSSVGEFLQQKFNEYVKHCSNGDFTISDDDKTIMEELLDWHMRFQVIDNSCKDLNNLSLKEWGRYSCLGKDGQQHVNVKGGYGALVDVLLKKLPEDVIFYNKIVEHIEVTSDNVLITCQDGSETHAQHVIFTCSLAILKHFRLCEKLPLLPSRADNIIDGMGFDGMGKVFLEFDYKWWANHIEGYQIIWRKRNNTSKEFPDWLRHISGFELVLDHPNMLLAWVGHKGCKEMEETHADIIGKQCVQLLRRFLLDETVPFPKGVYKSAWLTNPFIRGAYSHATKSCDTVPLPPARVLSDPFIDSKNVPRIFLAGEAIHESHFSTTHGAFESGQMQALKLRSYMNVKRNKII